MSWFLIIGCMIPSLLWASTAIFLTLNMTTLKRQFLALFGTLIRVDNTIGSLSAEIECEHCGMRTKGSKRAVIRPDWTVK